MSATNKPPKALPTQKPGTGKGKDAGQAGGGNGMDGLVIYLKGVRTEWTKVTWPSWPQIWGQTIVVLVMVTIITLSLFVLDYTFHFVITHITPHHS